MNYLEALNLGNKTLKTNNINTYRLDSELLLAKVVNKTREELLINLSNLVEPKKLKKFKTLLFRRNKKEPIAYIFKKDFWRYSFYVNYDVLIPRPETEIIIEEVLKLTSKSTSKSFLDVGTGSVA